MLSESSAQFDPHQRTLHLYQQSLRRQVERLCQPMGLRLDMKALAQLATYVAIPRFAINHDCAVTARQLQRVSQGASSVLVLPTLTVERMIWYLLHAERTAGLSSAAPQVGYPGCLMPGELSVEEAHQLGDSLQQAPDECNETLQPDPSAEDVLLLECLVATDQRLRDTALEEQRLLFEAHDVTRDVAFAQAAAQITRDYLGSFDTRSSE